MSASLDDLGLNVPQDGGQRSKVGSSGTRVAHLVDPRGGVGDHDLLMLWRDSPRCRAMRVNLREEAYALLRVSGLQSWYSWTSLAVVSPGLPPDHNRVSGHIGEDP